MKKIDWDKGFIGIDGRFRSKTKIEDWYREKIFKHKNQKRHGYKDIIRRRLGDIKQNKVYGTTGEKIIEYILNELKNLLIAPPLKLEKYRRIYDVKIHELKKEIRDSGLTVNIEEFNKEVLNAFNYKGFRSSLLPYLSAKLNIKCCPYCNMHYTLVVPIDKGGKSSKLITGFQFDHFFSKSRYPLLSMSLYNLIPACPNCNFSKSDNQLNIEFHPYLVDLHQKFRFEISDDELLLIRMIRNNDRLRVKLVPENPSDLNRVKNFSKEFNIEANYSRHRDIIEQINEEIYLERYYNTIENFSNLNLEIDSFKLKSEQFRKNLLLGGSSEIEDIGRYPLSKFRHDIYKFLKNKLDNS